MTKKELKKIYYDKLRDAAENINPYLFKTFDANCIIKHAATVIRVMSEYQEKEYERQYQEKKELEKEDWNETKNTKT